MGYCIKDEIGGDVGPFMLGYDPFLEPSDGLPPFELDGNFVANDVFEEVQIDLPLDGVAGEVEGTVDGDEDRGHMLQRAIEIYQEER